MLSDEQRIKQKEKKKKILAVAVLAVIGLFVIMGLIFFIASGIRNSHRNKKDENPQQSFNFYEPDYKLDILADEKYLGLDRNVWVFDGYSKTVITDDNYRSYQPEIIFMRDVLNYLITGNYTEYNKIFTEEYLNNAGDSLRDVFTMQQLYNIELEIIAYDQSRTSSEIITDSAVKVNYMIRHNDGTFRNDLPEETIIPVVYLLKAATDINTGNTEIKVKDIIKYSVMYD